VRYGHRLAISLLCLCLPVLAQAAPKADLWPRWQQHDPQNSAALDVSFWNTFLSTYVESQHPSGIHRVRYGTVSPAFKRISGGLGRRAAASAALCQ